MILDDFVVLGRAFPETLRDGRVSCCTAGYSESVGLCRIFPTHWLSKKLKRWNVISVPVDLAKHVSSEWRNESWKIKDSKNWKDIDNKIKIVGKLTGSDRLKLLHKIKVNCPAKLNEQKTSLGIVKPNINSYKIKDTEKGRKPYINYNCFPECFCKGHKQQLLEYGALLWIKNNPDKEDEVFENLHLNDDDWEKWFLIGNSYRAPRSFMIISILRFKKETKP